jgi:uncharacterized RDD family membrane protein YckC
VSERGLRDGDLVAIGSMRILFREEPVEGGGSGKVVLHPSSTPLACPSCGGEYRRGDLFCRECGAQVAQPSGPPKAVCASCGTAVPLPARFCNACGATLNPEGPPAVEPGDTVEPSRSDTQPVPVAPEQESPSPRAAGSMAMAPQRQAPPQPRTAASKPESVPPGRLERPSPRERKAEPVARRAPEPAEFAGRVAAFVVDSVFVLSGQAVLLAPVAWYWWAREAPRAPAEVTYLPVLASATLVPLALLLGALYHVYFWSVKGATPGKELLDLRVETDDGRSPLPLGKATLRVFGYILCVASLGVGFLMAAFGGSGLHDRISGTRVVKGPRS